MQGIWYIDIYIFNTMPMRVMALKKQLQQKSCRNFILGGSRSLCNKSVVITFYAVAEVYGGSTKQLIWTSNSREQ